MPNRSSSHGGKVWPHVISSGTLRTADLLRAFADEYRRVLPFNGTGRAVEAYELADLLDSNGENAEVREEADAALADLTDSLDDIAGREGLFFGAHDGDGACFGYWEPELELEAA